jgi:hypothetical protein
MALNCIYHPFQKMRVVEDEEYEKLVSSGKWFKHPLEAKKVREHYEEHIRQHAREGSSNCEQPSISPGTNAQRKRRVRKETTS